MTKEEKIKEAWDNVNGLNTNTWAKYYTYESVKHALTENVSLYMPSDSDFDSDLYLTPPQIIGIKNNNGWIKIESEADLPKENIDCWFVIDNDSYLGYFTKRGYFVNGSDDIELRFVTHYKPIEKPKPPIY